MNNNPLCPLCKNPIVIYLDYDVSDMECKACGLSWGGETRVFKHLDTKDGIISLTIDDDKTHITMPVIDGFYHSFEIHIQLPIDITEERLKTLLTFM